MPIHGYPGGVITANPVAPTSTVATGVWTTEQQLQAVSQGNWPFTIQPQQISRSLRFNSADSAYLNRTFASVGNRATWTWSAWVKRSFLDATATSAAFQTLFHAGVYTTVAFSADSIYFQMADGAGGAWYIQTSQVFRDPSAWYHIVAVLNTPSATASQRMRLYINGVEVTAFSTDQRSSITQSTTSGEINNNISHAIGSNTTPARYFSGYLTEINFVNGQALTPASFGQTNASTGVWEPIPYTGTYGTNGFELSFADNSGTTSTTLGADTSGNGNNWTPNNFSVTAGAGNDSLVDSPTSYGTDTGVGGTVRGNYCTLNPLDKGTNATLANGNLFGSTSTTAWAMIRSTFAISSGKWYWEFTVATTQIIIGLAKSNAALANYVGADANGWGWYGATGNKVNGGTQVTYVGVWAANDVIGVSFDADVGTLVFYKNGTSQGTAYTGLTSGPYFPAISFSAASDSANANFGQRAFAYTAPSGFKALCTQNLPTPTIGATSTTQANDYFNAVLYTGTGSSLGVTGVGFQPDWTWIKGRSGATDHGLYDAVRGVQKQLESNTTTAETTETTGLTAFGTNGFTVGALAQLNTSSATYVAWNWKANGAGSSNTAGTITSTVSASTASGFSIVTYTGTGANATVGHGIGTAPSMIFVKGRSGSGSSNSWRVYHSGANASPASGALYLNSTSAFTTDATAWNSTAPTSNVFSLGTDAGVNSTGTYVAYCFAPVAGYSAFGSYTGNGSADGPFVYVEFRPKYFMAKRTNAAGNSWILLDTARNTYNAVDAFLSADLSNAEATSYPVDFVSNGFKIRATTSNLNTNGGTYIYMAFAEFPFKFSLAR